MRLGILGGFCVVGMSKVKCAKFTRFCQPSRRDALARQLSSWSHYFRCQKYEARCGAAWQWENFCQTPGLSRTEMMSVTRCHLNAHIARICENKMHECEICCVNSLVDRDANHSKSTLQTRGSSVRRARFSPYTKYVLKWYRSDCLRKVRE